MATMELRFSHDPELALDETVFARDGRRITASRGEFPWGPGARALAMLLLKWAADDTLPIEATGGSDAANFRDLLRKEVNYFSTIFGVGGSSFLRNLIRTTNRPGGPCLVLNREILKATDIRVFVNGRRIEAASGLAELVQELERQKLKGLEERGALKNGPPPVGVLGLDDESYITRPADREFAESVRRLDSIVLLRGARQVGKTSLLARGIQEARGEGMAVVCTDLQEFDGSDLQSLDAFFRAVEARFAAQLNLEVDVGSEWDPHLGAGANFKAFLRDYVLGSVSSPVLWMMDEAGRLFGHDFGGDVFRLLRAVHNERALRPTAPWRRLTLAMACAEEPHLFIVNLDESPFNVGTSIVLGDFTPQQVAELNGRRGSPLRDGDLGPFHRQLDGHPYLTNRGLYEMAQRHLDFAAFKVQAEGLYSDHLRGLLLLAPERLEAVRAVLDGGSSPPPEVFYRLRAAGILAGDAPRTARLRCPLYEAYLRRNLP
ncbi:MAG TPA: AAA-like domain-containing protein [Isosphaeraceae bacterium]